MLRHVVVCALFALAVSNTTALAAEIVVKNDSIPPGAPVGGPIPGDRLGVLLTAPVGGTLVGVQIAWGSQLGGTPPSQEAAIRISEPGPLFSPGVTLATISSPILVDGALNEFRYLDPSTNLVPLAVPVVAGTAYFVDLEFLSNTQTSSFRPNVPSILADAVLDEPSKNFGYASNGATNGIWFPTYLGIPGVGDFGIRAIINPVPEPSTVALAIVGSMGLVAAAVRKKLRHRGV